MGNGPGAQEDSPIVAVDPLDPQKVISVWVNNDTADIAAPTPQVFLEGEYSVNGGQILDRVQQSKFCLARPKYHQSNRSLFAGYQSQREL